MLSLFDFHSFLSSQCWQKLMRKLSFYANEPHVISPGYKIIQCKRNIFITEIKDSFNPNKNINVRLLASGKKMDKVDRAFRSQ